MNKLSEVVELTSNLDFSSTYEKYCFKMLNAKYDITQEEFDKAIIEYTKRDRRFGNIDYTK